MTKPMLLLSFVILLNLSDCDYNKQNARITSLESDVKQLKAELVEMKQKPTAPEHHYELRNEGSRTFRFDPATGETCIQLTTPEDWKRKETKAQSCECVDTTQHYMEMPGSTDSEQKVAQHYYDLIVKPSCGN